MMAEDYNLEEEYGWFLDGVLKYVEDNPEDFLEHYGVKGMHWGVRNERPTSTLVSLGPSKIVRKTASGEELTLEKNPPTVIHKALAKLSRSYREDYRNFASLTIKDSSGKSVGSAQIHKKSADELNLVWMSVDKSARGRGYATATMKAAEEFGRQTGAKKLTLEVPGNAPDARHIYEKMGFKVTKEADDAETDPVWGGLTEMEYRFGEVKHMTTSTSQLAHVSEKPWSDYSKADYNISQWHNACLIHQHSGEPTSKDQCKLPVKTPGGAVNRNGVHAAAAALAGARGGVQASPGQMATAKSSLKRFYSELGEDAPDSLKQSAVLIPVNSDHDDRTSLNEMLKDYDPSVIDSLDDDDVQTVIAHYGVKGMKWGVRKNEARLLPGASTSMKIGRAAGNSVARRRKKSSSSEPASEDFSRATDLHSRAKSHGTRVLTNTEMRKVIERMNLEKQYSELTVGEGRAGSSKARREGSKFVTGVLKNVGQQVAAEILKGHAMARAVDLGLTAAKK
jgi:ribosomal protein S18 acetylase RimI-like enzyme